MNFTFLKPSGAVSFFRSDAEQADWTQHELSLLCTFPYMSEKVITRGMIILFQDPATNTYQAYYIRKCVSNVSEGYQQITAEDLAITELNGCHIPDKIEFTDERAAGAIGKVLAGTGWIVGENKSTEISSGDIGRGSVWEAVCDIRTNWNAVVLPRVTVDASGITGRYLDIYPAGGTWRGLRLAVNKNLSDPCIDYDDSELYTALYAYGATYSEGEGEDAKTLETMIDTVSWTKTDEHPAKPKGQKYIEDPTKTALYGLNGKPRFGYYQNGEIKDPAVLLQKAWESLKACYEPKVSITGTLADLKRFGYADQPVRLYDLAIIEIEPLGIQLYKQIIQLTVDLLDPSNTEPNIGDYIPNIIYINRETDDQATGGGSGRGGGSRSKKEFSEYETDLNRNQKVVWAYARKVDEQGNILNQAGWYIDPETGVLIYAEDNENNIGSRLHVQSDRITAEVTQRENDVAILTSNITQTANEISAEVAARKSEDKKLSGRITVNSNKVSMVVEEKNGENVIKAANIVAAINDKGGSEILLEADTINLTGYTTISQMRAVEAEINNLITGSTKATFLQAYSAGIDSLTANNSFRLGSYTATWKLIQYKNHAGNDAEMYVLGRSAS